MTQLNLKPTHAPVKAYYETLAKFGAGKFDNEGNIRGAFEDLLKKCARQCIPEYQLTRTGKHPLRADAAMLDAFNLPRAYWEAKDTKDDLRVEMEKKLALGYPRTNILFQSPTQALLVQNGRIESDADITDPAALVDTLRLFFEYRQPNHDDWDRAVREFSERIPAIARGAMTLIEAERKTNKLFVERFTAFANLCRDSINPDLKDEAVEEMLVQHLLTERIFRHIFANPEFTRRNVIAAEIEKVIDSLTKRYFSRDAFLKELDPFYKAIEEAAETTATYTEKQAFLNKVYERFFQGFSKKQADTHGIVYTPQPIVDFMVRSVEEVLKTEFGRSLSDKGVHILDPFVGTGNFITRIMQEIKTSALPQKYKEELHCNEVMLLPYYIASMNIEHAYLDKVGEYEPFEGICLVDTFELAEAQQASLSFMNEENTARTKRQKNASIFVIVGNPPYNSWQGEENDDAKNRKYPTLDKHVSRTYSKDSSAVNKNSLGDPYIKAIRWASDRIGTSGIVALVTKNSFAEGKVTEGVRKHLLRDFSSVFVLDLGGDVRDNTRLSGTTHNVFGIQVGVSINFFLRNPSDSGAKRTVRSFQTDEYWTKAQKFDFLDQHTIGSLSWRDVPLNSQDWICEEGDVGFKSLLGLTDVFAIHSNGLKSNRDPWAYNADRHVLENNIRKTTDFYHQNLERWLRSNQKETKDPTVDNDDKRISWSRDLKADLKRGRRLEFEPSKIRPALYRPFYRTNVYFDRILNEEVYALPRIYPAGNPTENISIVATIDKQIEFSVMAAAVLPCVHLGGRPSQCFPLYTYDEDGANRTENIKDSCLQEFRVRYGSTAITGIDVFY